MVLEFDGETPTTAAAAAGVGGVGKIPGLAGWFARGRCLTATDVVLESAAGILLTKYNREINVVGSSK